MPHVAGPRVFADRSTDRILAIDPRAVGAEFDRSEDRGNEATGTIAIVCIEGPTAQRAGWFWDGYDAIRERFTAALACADAVVLKINSPGGEAAGCFETAKAMRAEADAAGKLVIAYSDESCYSAAYALACAADEIYLPESGGVGSVGVLCVVGDRTKMTEKAGLNIVVIRSGDRKADGHPDIPLTDAVVSRFQSRIDTLAGQFADLVSDSRDVSRAKILGYQGDVFYGADAVKAGLADAVMSWDDMLAGLAARIEDGKARAGNAAPSGNNALDNTPPVRSEGKSHGSEITHPQSEPAMTLTELYAALKAAQAAGDAAKVADLQAKIDAAIAEAKADEDAEDDEADDDEASDDDSDEDAEDDEADEDADDDGDDDSDEEDDEDAKAEAAAAAKKAKSKKAKKPPFGGKKGKKASAGATTAEALLSELFPNMSRAKIRGKLLALKATQEHAKAQEDRVNKLETDAKASKVRALVKRGIAAGQIPPAQKEFWTRQGMASVATLREFLATAPRVVSTSETRPGPDTPGAAGMTALEHEVSTRLGVDPKAFSEHKTKLAQLGGAFRPNYSNQPAVLTEGEKRRGQTVH